MQTLIKSLALLAIYLARPIVIVGTLAIFALGLHSAWQDLFDEHPSFFLGFWAFAGLTLIGFLIGLMFLQFIKRKTSETDYKHYWDPETATSFRQSGAAYPSIRLAVGLFLLAYICILPLYAYLLPDQWFRIAAAILLVACLLCFVWKPSELVERSWDQTFYPRTQEFMDFYMAVLNEGVSSREAKACFQKINESSIDYLVAKRILAHSSGIYVSTSHGPGFDATPENLLAKSKADTAAFEASLKTHEYLG